MNEQFSRVVGQILLSEESKQDRWVIRDRVIFWLVVFLVVAPLLYWAKAAKADTTTMVYSDPQVTLRLLLKPCTAPEVLKFLKPEAHAEYREAILVWEGRTLLCCWREEGDGVRTMDEEGDKLTPDLPKAAFKRDSGA